MSSSLATSTRGTARLAALQQSTLGHGRAPLDPRHPTATPSLDTSTRHPGARDVSLNCSVRFATNPSARSLASTLVADAKLNYPFNKPSKAHLRDPIDVVQNEGGRFVATARKTEAGQMHQSRSQEATMCHQRNPPRLPKNDRGLYPRPNTPYTGFGQATPEDMRLASAQINAQFDPITGALLINDKIQAAIDNYNASVTSAP